MSPAATPGDAVVRSTADAVPTAPVARAPALDAEPALAPLLAQWPAPALLVDADGVVLAANDRAHDLLAGGGDVEAHDRAGGAEWARGRMLAGLLGVDATRALLAGSGLVRLAGGPAGGALTARARAAKDGRVLVSLEAVDVGDSVDIAQAERLASIGELLSSVAHELNNPLTSVLGYAELLLSEEGDAVPREELQRIHDEATRCRRIVTNLLDLARSDGLVTRPLLVDDVIDRVLEFRAYAAQVSGVRLERRSECGDDAPIVLGDFHRLVQAVLNLVTNAEHAVESRAAGRWISVTTRSTPGGVAIVVEDNGPGVPPELAQRIFDPFVTSKPRGSGTGLGLSLVRSAAEAHGGSVRVERGSEGGARFVLELPTAC